MFKRINMKSRGSIQRSDVACLLFGNAEFCRKMMSQILENVFRLRHSLKKKHEEEGNEYIYLSVLSLNGHYQGTMFIGTRRDNFFFMQILR